LKGQIFYVSVPEISDLLLTIGVILNVFSDLIRTFYEFLISEQEFINQGNSEDFSLADCFKGTS
jgi:hypothetical protein